MNFSRAGHRHLPPGLIILHEDRDILVVHKPAGMLTMASDSEKVKTAYFSLTDYVRKGNPKSRHRIFIVHRLDRDTSGIVLFAKTEDAKRKLQDGWDQTSKRYAAVVHGVMDKPQGTIISYLVENGVHKVYSTPDSAKGKLSHTVWSVVRTKQSKTLLDVELLTGRKHQIRVHMAGIGHPVVGDRKYGLTGDHASRLALHARELVFHHPYSGAETRIEAPIPLEMLRLIGSAKI